MVSDQTEDVQVKSEDRAWSDTLDAEGEGDEKGREGEVAREVVVGSLGDFFARCRRRRR